MTLPLGSDPIALDRDQAPSLARLLREVEQFLDECGEPVEAALAAHFRLHPASEAFRRGALLPRGHDRSRPDGRSTTAHLVRRNQREGEDRGCSSQRACWPLSAVMGM